MPRDKRQRIGQTLVTVFTVCEKGYPEMGQYIAPQTSGSLKAAIETAASAGRVCVTGLFASVRPVEPGTFTDTDLVECRMPRAAVDAFRRAVPAMRAHGSLSTFMGPLLEYPDGGIEGPCEVLTIVSDGGRLKLNGGEWVGPSGS